MKPGATLRPATSTVLAACSSTVPTLTIRPSLIPTSACRGDAPVPSTTVPPLSTYSNMAASSELPEDVVRLRAHGMQRGPRFQGRHRLGSRVEGKGTENAGHADHADGSQHPIAENAVRSSVQAAQQRAVPGAFVNWSA